MPTFSIHLAIKAKADNEAEALGMAQAAAAHLHETFNDDGSLRGLHWYGPGFAVVPLEVLRALIDGADFGQDQKDYDAGRLEDDNGKDDDTREMRTVVKTWRAAVCRGLRIEQAATPRKPRARAKPAAEVRA